MGNVTEKKKVLTLDDDQLRDIYSHHRLMVLYLRGYQEKLAAHSDVEKHMDKVHTMLCDAGAMLELSGNLVLDVEAINKVIASAKGHAKTEEVVA